VPPDPLNSTKIGECLGPFHPHQCDRGQPLGRTVGQTAFVWHVAVLFTDRLVCCFPWMPFSLLGVESHITWMLKKAEALSYIIMRHIVPSGPPRRRVELGFVRQYRFPCNPFEPSFTTKNVFVSKRLGPGAWLFRMISSVTDDTLWADQAHKSVYGRNRTLRESTSFHHIISLSKESNCLKLFDKITSELNLRRLPLFFWGWKVT
jgi:hypothetical protein